MGCASLGYKKLELCDVQTIRIRDTTETLNSGMVMALDPTCYLKEFGVNCACQLAAVCVISDSQLIWKWLENGLGLKYSSFVDVCVCVLIHTFLHVYIFAYTHIGVSMHTSMHLCTLLLPLFPPV